MDSLLNSLDLEGLVAISRLLDFDAILADAVISSSLVTDAVSGMFDKDDRDCFSKSASIGTLVVLLPRIRSQFDEKRACSVSTESLSIHSPISMLQKKHLTKSA